MPFLKRRGTHVKTDDIIDIALRSGSFFETSLDQLVAANGMIYSIFQTGSNPVLFFGRELSYDGVGVNAFVNKDFTYTGGTLFTDFNSPNDINPKASTSSFLIGATVTDEGIFSRAPKYIYGNTSVQGRGSPTQAIDKESPQMIKPNSQLLFILKSRDINNPQNIASHVKFIEPSSIPGLVFENGTFKLYNGELL